MITTQFLNEIKKNDLETVIKFITEKVHPDEIKETNSTLMLEPNKRSKFDKIMLERERLPNNQDNNETLQETAAIGINIIEGSPDLITFINAWDPDSFQFELNLTKKPGKETNTGISMQ